MQKHMKVLEEDPKNLVQLYVQFEKNMINKIANFFKRDLEQTGEIVQKMLKLK